MGHFVVWTDEQSEAINDFVLEGLTYREVTEQLNAKFGTTFSRNAVIGRAKRIGIASPAKPPPKNPPRPKRDPSMPRYARRADPSPTPRAAIEMRCAEIEPLHLTLLDLEPHHCRWPYSESPNITFCGHSKMIGSYCLAHFQLSVGTGTAAERAAV